MAIIIREYQTGDLPAVTKIWNDVVMAGNAFPQLDQMDMTEAGPFFASQSFTGVAVDGDEIVGLYILHPNNIGRCGHLANASYAVKTGQRRKGIGEKLVVHSLAQGKALGFRVLQFNAVVENNIHAIRLYEKLGFVRLGTVPGGFLSADGKYETIILFYHTL